jgi:thymidylate synthase
MNNLDNQYLKICKDILENGKDSGDRTGTGTRKVFGRMLRHDMQEGFPILTTRKMFYKNAIHELL